MKMINKNSVSDILTVLKSLGYECGTCIKDSSSYPVRTSEFLPDGRSKENVWEIWAYLPDPEWMGLTESELLGKLP